MTGVKSGCHENSRGDVNNHIPRTSTVAIAQDDTIEISQVSQCHEQSVDKRLLICLFP